MTRGNFLVYNSDGFLKACKEPLCSDLVFGALPVVNIRIRQKCG